MSATVYEGDCLSVMAGLEAESFDSVITDPPYGVDFQSNHRRTIKKHDKIAGDERAFIWFLKRAFELTKPGGALICFCDWKTQEEFRLAIRAAGYDIRSHLVWDRDWHGMGDLKAQFAPMHDVAWFATKGKFQFPGKRPRSVLRHRRPGSEAEHPTQKPDGLMRELCAAVTPPGGTVLDPFTGSGSTGRGAVLEGFNFIGVELSPAFAEIARRRIAAAQPLPVSFEDMLA